MALSVGAVLALTVRANVVNTLSLLNARAIELIDGMEREIASEASQAVRVVTALSGLYSDGSFDMAESPERHAVLAALLRTAPAVRGIIVFGDNGPGNQGRAVSLFRTPAGGFMTLSDAPTLRDRFDLASIRDAETPVWGMPAAIEGALFHNIGLPLVRDGRREGVAIAVVGQDMVSQIMTRLARERLRAPRPASSPPCCGRWHSSA